MAPSQGCHNTTYQIGHYDSERDSWEFEWAPKDSMPMWSAVYRSEDEIWCWFRRRLIQGRTWFSSRVIRTTDRGASWETVLDTILFDSVMIEEISFNGESDILLATISGPVRSTDNGQTWIEEPVENIPQLSSSHIEFPVGTEGIFFTSGINDPGVYLPKGALGVRVADSQKRLGASCVNGLQVVRSFSGTDRIIDVSFNPTSTGEFTISAYSISGELIATSKLVGILGLIAQEQLPIGPAPHTPVLIVVSGPCGATGQVIRF